MEHFLCVLAVHLHGISIWGPEVYVFEMLSTKTGIVENSHVMSMHVTYSIYRRIVIIYKATLLA